jgi:2-methylisocitrate lyase-like PEP mutase family enzyme
MATQSSKAESFRAMHYGPHILLLPNAWDSASARIFEESAFSAIATTSAGIAFALGYRDGQRIPRQEMLDQVARIVRVVNVPVTADVESGYGDRPEDAAQTARAVIEAGAIGMNLEDATGDSAHPLTDLPLQIEKIKAVMEAGKAAGVPLVLNARTDVYLAQVGAPDSRYQETLRRLTAYREAGANCLFAPGIREARIIAKLIKDLQAPLNILAVSGAPSVPELEKLGVARVSVGSGPMRATLGLVQRFAQELKQQGTYSALENAPSYDQINQIMSRKS